MGTAGQIAYKRYAHLGIRAAVKAYFQTEPAAKAHLLATHRRHPSTLDRIRTKNEQKCEWPSCTWRAPVGVDRIAQIIRSEETTYFKLLEKAPAIVKKAFPPGSASPTADELAELWDQEGIDPEIVLTILELVYYGDVVLDVRNAVKARQRKGSHP